MFLVTLGDDGGIQQWIRGTLGVPMRAGVLSPVPSLMIMFNTWCASQVRMMHRWINHQHQLNLKNHIFSNIWQPRAGKQLPRVRSPW